MGTKNSSIIGMEKKYYKICPYKSIIGMDEGTSTSIGINACTCMDVGTCMGVGTSIGVGTG